MSNEAISYEPCEAPRSAEDVAAILMHMEQNKLKSTWKHVYLCNAPAQIYHVDGVLKAYCDKHKHLAERV